MEYIKPNIQVSTLGLSRLRIGLSLITVYSLFIRYFMLDPFYTVNGLLPLNMAQRFSDNADSLFLIYYPNSDLFTHLLFISGIICSLLLLMGWQSRIFAAACFAIMLFLDSRNQFVLNAGYETIRVLMFWLIFFPTDMHYSLKTRFKKGTDEKQLNGWLVIAFVTQVLFFYLFGAIHKSSPYWISTGEALEMALANKFMSYEWTNFILNYKDFLKVLTHAVFLLESVSPFLLMVFWSHLKVRRYLLYGLIFFHMSILLFFKIGFLPIANIFALISLLPSSAPSRSVGNKSAIALFIYLVLININSVPAFRRLPQSIFMPSRWILMDQAWMFFAPHPYSFDGWWSLKTLNENGTESIIRLHGAKLNNDEKTFYRHEVSMEEKTILLHLQKPLYQDYRFFVLERLCKHTKEENRVVQVRFALNYIDLPTKSSDSEYQEKILGSVLCN